MIATLTDFDKSVLTLRRLTDELESFSRSAAAEGVRQYDVERHLLKQVLAIGKAAMDLYLGLQGDGDCGPTLLTAAGQELQRSAAALPRPLRTIFGEHALQAFVYGAGPHAKIELRPLDAQIELPAGKFSYLFEEFSQYFCVEQAFGAAAQRVGAVFGQRVAVDSLERISRRLGAQADAFLQELPTPPAPAAGALLVVSADGKGVPLVQADVAAVPAFEERERPGNRRMATLGCVYTVDPYPRTAQDILAALFRDTPATPPAPRPEPQGKHLKGSFSHFEWDGAAAVPISGTIETFGWLAQQVEKRRRPGQRVIRLMDGQPSLWDAAALCLASIPAAETVEILDVVHVASYVWRAAKVFQQSTEHREAFVWDRLERILGGDTKGVIGGLRRMATQRGLTGANRREITTVCRYFENNLQRMRYDVYLHAGYPIATGVIEGACRHLVKDRLERSGMRWTLAGAKAMLNIRAVVASDHWEEFNQCRMANEQARLHPHAALVRHAPTAVVPC
jgi:hypothetical protein